MFSSFVFWVSYLEMLEFRFMASVGVMCVVFCRLGLDDFIGGIFFTFVVRISVFNIVGDLLRKVGVRRWLGRFLVCFRGVREGDSISFVFFNRGLTCFRWSFGFVTFFRIIEFLRALLLIDILGFEFKLFFGIFGIFFCVLFFFGIWEI